MGYGFPLTSAARVETLGYATGAGVQISSSSAGVYGSLATIGTTGFAYDGFVLQIQTFSARYWKFTVTVQTGGGADETIVEDGFYSNSNGGPGGCGIWFPIRVPANATIKVKAADSTGSSSFYATVTGYQGDQNLVGGFSRAVSLTNYATNSVYPANTITLNGTTLTGWSELCSATSQAVTALMLCFNGCGSSFGSNIRCAVELGYGASGSETGTSIRVMTNLGSSSPNVPFILPYFIPAGTRLAMRAQCAAAQSVAAAISAVGFQR